MANLLKNFMSNRNSPSKARPPPPRKPTSEEYKAELARCWTYIHKNYFFDNGGRSIASVAETELPQRLQEIATILQNDNDPSDAARNQTSPCMEYFLKSQIVQRLYEHAVADEPPGMVLLVTKLFSTLVNELDGRFLDQAAVRTPILKLIQKGLTVKSPDSDALNEQLVNLMFAICTKLLENPNLLALFFCEKEPDADASSTGTPRKAARPSAVVSDDPVTEHEFPVFVYLLHFINDTGHVGDYARAALLHCLEVATPAVDRFIARKTSFCSSVIGVLGSVYCDLPSNLKLVHGAASAAAIASSPRFKAYLDMILYVEQALRKAHEPVALALLEEFQIAFLERFVRPQLSEDGRTGAFEMTASGQDDAITVATTYTETILRKIDNVYLGWAYGVLLLGNGSELTPSSRRPMTARAGAEPLRHTLIRRLESASPALADSTWRLLHTLISRHPTPMTLRLFPAIGPPCPAWVPFSAPLSPGHCWTTATLEANAAAPTAVVISASLAVRYIMLLPFNDKRVESDGYDEYLKDAEHAHQFAAEAVRQLMPFVPTEGENAKDPELFLPVLLRQLGQFLTSSEERNLMVTGILAALAVFPDLRLFNHIFNSDVLGDAAERPAAGTATTVYGMLLELSMRITQASPSRSEVASPRVRPAEASAARPLEDASNGVKYVHSVVYYEEFVKELAAAIQVQHLDGASRLAFVESD